jgi:signal transduction histidine kinase
MGEAGRMKKKQIIQIILFIGSAGIAQLVYGTQVAGYVVIVAIVFLGVDYLAEYRQKQTIHKMCEDIDKVLHGNYHIILSDYSEGNLSVLQNEIHKMTIRMNEQTQRLKQEKTYLSDSLADISHQLKTPLTSMNIILSFLMQEEVSKEKRFELSGKLNTSMRHIEWLISTLLKLSQFDAGTVQFQKREIKVKGLIEKCYEMLAVPMELKNQQFQCNICEEVYVGDFAWSLEALENIIKNCMEHTPDGGVICVKAEENPLYTQVIVEDNGTGISKEDLPYIFQRFYKGKNADSSSVGIGLSLAAMIIKRQNGTIAVKMRKEGGTQFTIKFYK